MPEKILYLDCFSGAAGDMLAGALLDAGVGSFKLLRGQLNRLGLEGWSIGAEKVRVNGIAATKFEVVVDEAAQKPRSYAGIKTLIKESGLAEAVKRDALSIFQKIAEAEASGHGEQVDKVHFHEVGMVDSIIDVIGACILFAESGAGLVYSSPLVLGSGMVETRHGPMPVPAPATVNLLKGVPVTQGAERQEMTTPTGAALICHFANGFGPLPDMKLTGCGYGAGTHKTTAPNLLRVFMGEELSRELPQGSGGFGSAQTLLETNIDDSTPEQTAYLADQLLMAGAADAWITPVVMKKGRAAVMLSVLCAPEETEQMLDLVFRESPTFGVRIRTVNRRCLKRREKQVETPFGPIRVKIGEWRGKEVTASPEFEDCRKAAEKHGVPISEVYRSAQANAGR